MNIEINEDQVQKAAGESIQKALDDALSGWQVQDLLKKTIADQIATGAMVEGVKRAMESIDASGISSALAKQIEIAATQAVIALIKESFVDVACRMRGVKDYAPDYESRRAAMMAEMFRGVK